MSAEDTASYVAGDKLFKAFAEILVEGVGFGGGSCVEIIGAVALGVVCKEGELRDNEGRASDVVDREIHLVVFVAKDAELRYFCHELVGILFGVSASHSEENGKTVTAGADGFAVNLDRGA